MFTTEPTLSQRIERMIGDTPVVDTHAHLRPGTHAASGLAELLAEPCVVTELRSVGMPESDLSPARSAPERVALALPYLRRMRNTATAWCLYRILRDLFDVYDHELTDAIVPDLLDKVAATGRDPSWPGGVLERANLRTVVNALPADPALATKARPTDLYRLDLTGLTVAGVACDHATLGDVKKPVYFETLCERLGRRPATTGQLDQAVRDWLDRTVTGPVRFASTFLPADRRILPPDESHAQFVLNQVGDEWEVGEADVDGLARFVTWSVMGWLHENKKSLQVLVGSERGLPRAPSSWGSEMAEAFQRFPRVRFDLVVGSEGLIQETAALARAFPNVYVSGYSGRNLVPGTIQTALALRVQTAPMTKVGGFLSDAGCVEWVYARLQLVKKATAGALAQLVATGHYEEDEVPAILRQIFHETPLSLHDLGPR